MCKNVRELNVWRLIHLFANLLIGYLHFVTKIGLWSSYHPAIHQKSKLVGLAWIDTLTKILYLFNLFCCKFFPRPSSGAWTSPYVDWDLSLCGTSPFCSWGNTPFIETSVESSVFKLWRIQILWVWWKAGCACCCWGVLE